MAVRILLLASPYISRNQTFVAPTRVNSRAKVVMRLTLATCGPRRVGSPRCTKRPAVLGTYPVGFTGELVNVFTRPDEQSR